MNKGIRIINCLIDLLLITIISAIVSGIVGNSFDKRVILFVVFFLYYFLFESFLGQTVGKKVTKTYVIDLSNSRPNILRVFIRTLLRFNPFDGMSYLFGIGLGAHDTLSRTKLEELTAPTTAKY